MAGSFLAAVVTPKHAGSGPSSSLMLILLAVACLALAGIAVYTFVVLPRRRREPLRRALPLLASDQADDLRRAEQLLSQAVAAGLRRRDLADARFALGFVRAMLGTHDEAKYQQAAVVISELEAARGHDADSAYLALWLASRLGNHDRVAELCERYGGLLADMAQTKLIASISYLAKGAEHWRRGAVDGALHWFDLVRELGVLRGHVPGRTDDLQVINGIRAIFDDRMGDARRSFAGAQDRARKRQVSTVQADLGLIACSWRAGDALGVERDLGAIVPELDARAANAENAENAEEELLQSHARLLFAVALLRAWLVRLPGDSQLPAAELAEFRRRIERARHFDPELGDPLLLLGLIEYYFAPTGADRAAAIELLDQATTTARGIKLPEVLDLIKRERKREHDEVARYLAVVREYLQDPGVPVALRAELKRRLAEFEQYRAVGEVDLAAQEHGPAPSVDDIVARGRLLHRRISAIVAPRLHSRGDGHLADDVQRLAEALTNIARVVAKDVDEMQRGERDLMLRTGEFLLPEDPVPGAVEEATGDA